MKRAFKVALTLFVVVLVAIVLILNSFGGRLIQKTVNVAGPAALGVPVSLEKAEFHLLRGHVLLKGLTVGNPDGFKTDGIFELGQLTVDLNTRSLLSGVVHIRKILIDAPKITYERGLPPATWATCWPGWKRNRIRRAKKPRWSRKPPRPMRRAA
jgi:uncharacterized protein involved in outer membrane biogenesis